MHMTQYIITYLGGDQPSSPEEGKQHFERISLASFLSIPPWLSITSSRFHASAWYCSAVDDSGVSE